MKKFIYILIAAISMIQCNKSASDKMANTAVKNNEAFRTQPPGAAPARPINLGNYATFTLDNGLQVIVVENHKLPRVSYQITLNNDPILEGDQIGYVEFAGDLISKGTTSRNKAKIDEEVDFIGATLNSTATGIFASSLKKHSTKLLDLMTDILYNPTFPEDEFEKAKKQTLSGLSTAKTDANAIASNVSARINYGNKHPYGEIQTEKTVNNISIDNCKKYFNTYFKPNNAYLVIVGDITEAIAKEQVNKYFAKWKKGEIPSQSYKVNAPPSVPSVAFANKDGAVQSVINITYPVDFKIGSQDELTGVLMNNILGGGIFSGRLMQNLREKHAYTYGARSSLTTDKLVGNFNAFASVRNMVTDSSVSEFLYEMKRIGDEPVSESDIQLAKNSMAGGFARSLESPQTIANFALNTFKYNLPKDYYNTYLSRLEKITIADVQRIAKKYITPQNAHILVVGNKDEVASKLLKFDGDGKIDYYDAFGEVLNYDNVAVPADVTATSIIEDYIDAIGGKNKLQQIKSLSTNASMSIMGREASITTKQVIPDKYFVAMKMGETLLQEQKLNGLKASSTQMGQAAKTYGPGDKNYEDMKDRIKIFDQLSYDDSGYKLEMKGMEDFNGIKCYKVQVTNPGGDVITQFYDVKTSLLLKTTQVEGEGEQAKTVTTEYKDYKEISGILMPYEIAISGQGPMPFNLKINSYELNGLINEMDFEIK